MTRSLDEQITSEYSRLSVRLRAAADHVLAHPADIATRSLRAVASSSGLAPATYSRLARALGYEDYEALREECRILLRKRIDNFEARAGRLQEEMGKGANMLERQSAACIANIAQLPNRLDQERLEWFVAKLSAARRVAFFGALSSRGIAEYVSYVANYLSDQRWEVPGPGSCDWAASLTGLNREDLCIVVTKPPFSAVVIEAAAAAKRRGATVVLITDDPLCPAIEHADAVFMVSSDSPQFFSSYAATLVLLETVLGMLAARGGEAVRSRIADVEACSRRLGLVKDGA